MADTKVGVTDTLDFSKEAIRLKQLQDSANSNTAINIATIIAAVNALAANSFVVNSPVVAAGNSLGTAAALLAGITKVTGADNTKGVALPAAVSIVAVFNSDATHTLAVYPHTSGGQINAVTAGSAYTMTAAVGQLFIPLGSDNWFTIPLLGS